MAIIYIFIVQRNGAPGTKRPISHTCSAYVLHIRTASVNVKLEISTIEDDSHGSEDDCHSKTEADRSYRDHEDAKYRRAKTLILTGLLNLGRNHKGWHGTLEVWFVDFVFPKSHSIEYDICQISVLHLL